MNTSVLSNMLNKIKGIINSNNRQDNFGFSTPMDVLFNGNSFFVLMITDYKIDGPYSEFSRNTISLGANLIHKQKIEKSIFIELNKLINHCEKVWPNPKEYEELKKELAQIAEFQDVLESL
jgi:hypothetical protein